MLQVCLQLSQYYKIMTFEEGIWMAIILNGIGLPIFFLAYYIAFKKHDDEERKKEEDKKPKPWQW